MKPGGTPPGWRSGLALALSVLVQAGLVLATLAWVWDSPARAQTGAGTGAQAGTQSGARTPDPAPFRIIGTAPYCDATVVEGPNPRGASASAPQGRAMILYDPDVMATLPYVKPFVMAHECGHHALDHTTPGGLLREGHLFAAKELDADCWAAGALARAGEIRAVLDQIALLRAQTTLSAGPRYPAWRTRIRRIERCLEAEAPASVQSD